MARSPLTLAASVTSALPGVGVVGVAPLTSRAIGRFDSAVADLDDGRRVVVRAPSDDAAARQLAAESRALRALTPGVRALLPFRVPEPLGETWSGDVRTTVVNLLPGYQVDAAHLPAGEGAATSIGIAIAAIHALPTSIARAEGLPVRTAGQVREDLARLVNRATATRRLPVELAARWHAAIDAEPLWRFESTVILDGLSATSFLLGDSPTGPVVSGVLDWHGLSVGDPAIDIQWLATAPDASDDVFEAYATAADRAPDPFLRQRARLHAELEFARWLLHGHEGGETSIVNDAVELLTSLAAGVRDDDLLSENSSDDVERAFASADRVAEPVQTDTAMQTDAYDPEQLAQYLAENEEPADANGDFDVAVTDDMAVTANEPVDPHATAPIDLTSWGAIHDLRATPADTGARSDTGPIIEGAHDPEGDALEAQRATRAALRRWSNAD